MSKELKRVEQTMEIIRNQAIIIKEIIIPPSKKNITPHVDPDRETIIISQRILYQWKNLLESVSRINIIS